MGICICVLDFYLFCQSLLLTRFFCEIFGCIFFMCYSFIYFCRSLLSLLDVLKFPFLILLILNFNCPLTRDDNLVYSMCVYIYIHTHKHKNMYRKDCVIGSKYLNQLFSEFSCLNGNRFFNIQVLHVYQNRACSLKFMSHQQYCTL